MRKRYPTGPIKGLLRQYGNLQRFKKSNTDRYKLLTERELEVLALIAYGMKNPAIAQELDIARATVQNHRASIREKLNVTNQTEYVKYALAYDLIEF